MDDKVATDPGEAIIAYVKGLENQVAELKLELQKRTDERDAALKAYLSTEESTYGYRD